MKFPAGITTFIFDLDGTLRHNKPNTNHQFFAFAAKLGVNGSSVNRRNAAQWAHRYWAQSKMLLEDSRKFGSNDVDFWINYVERNLVAYGCSVEQSQALAPDLRTMMSEEYNPDNWVPEDVHPALESLKNKGFKMGLVSNRRKPANDELKELGLAQFFDFTLVAGEIDSWKPNREIFDHALKMANSSAQNSIYIGDNYYADIIGANNAGLIPVLIDPEEIFPEPGCRVISKIEDLIGMIPPVE